MILALVQLLFFLVISLDKISALGILPFVFGVKHLLVILLAFIIALYARKKLTVKGKSLFCFIAFVLYVVIQCFFLNLRPTSFWIGVIFTCFPLLAFLFGSSLVVDVARLNKIIYSLCIISIVAAFPAFVFLLSGNDIRLNSWMFREAGALSAAMVATILYSLYLYKVRYIDSRKLSFLIAIPLIIVAFATLKKDLIALLVSILVISAREVTYVENKYIRKLSIFFLFLLVIISPVLVKNIADNIIYFQNVGSEGHVRLAMYLTAFKINLDSFFVGSGLGSFGSLGSIIGDFSLSNGINYELSPIYLKYGIENLAGNSADKLNMGEAGTLLDTFWPHIFGELGIIGTILFALTITSFLDFGYFTYIPSLIVISLYFDGLFLIIPESPLFVFYSIFLPAILIKSLKASGKD